MGGFCRVCEKDEPAADEISDESEKMDEAPASSSSKLSSASSSLLGKRTSGGTGTRRASGMLSCCGVADGVAKARSGLEAERVGAAGMDSLRIRERRFSSSSVSNVRRELRSSSLASRRAVIHSYLLCEETV